MARACFTYGSLSCSASHCRLDLVRLAMTQDQQQLSEKQKKYLRGLAHGRDPIILIGSSGLSPGVTKEFDVALGAHELVKVKARVGDREERDNILAELAKQSGSSLVQRI